FDTGASLTQIGRNRARHRGLLPKTPPARTTLGTATGSQSVSAWVVPFDYAFAEMPGWRFSSHLLVLDSDDVPCAIGLRDIERFFLFESEPLRLNFRLKSPDRNVPSRVRADTPDFPRV